MWYINEQRRGTRAYERLHAMKNSDENVQEKNCSEGSERHVPSQSGKEMTYTKKLKEWGEGRRMVASLVTKNNAIVM